MVMNLINLVLGIILLTTGKKLYWLLWVWLDLSWDGACSQLTLTPDWLVYVVALGAGILGQS
jgi:hypothetical protein